MNSLLTKSLSITLLLHYKKMKPEAPL